MILCYLPPQLKTQPKTGKNVTAKQARNYDMRSKRGVIFIIAINDTRL